MKAIYDASANSLTEQPEMEKPEPHKHIGFLLYDEQKRKQYHKEMDEYSAHIASLRKLLCSPEAVNSFRHGIQYEEGKDYKVIWHYYAPDEKELRAVPLDPPPPDPFPELISRIATLFSEGKGNEEIAGVLREEWVISKK
jgi:hypothetical protein